MEKTRRCQSIATEKTQGNPARRPAGLAHEVFFPYMPIHRAQKRIVAARRPLSRLAQVIMRLPRESALQGEAPPR
ncbi:MAG: hypothetical protein LBF51_09260 [Zoogloeaceae bacterium]|nr:hypothetical protein [Zoogloeaceae bacterium]